MILRVSEGLQALPENILIIKPTSLGDVVHALPVLAKLRDAFPDARVSWLVAHALAPLVESNHSLDAVYRFHRRAGGFLGTAKANIALAGALRRADFDCVIDLQGLLRSALFARATGAPMRVGLSDAREGSRGFYTHIAKVEGAVHAVDRYLRVGEVLGFDGEEAHFGLEMPQWAHQAVARILESHEPALPRPYIALSPGARWPTKMWPAENFTEAARLLGERFGGTVFLVGTEREAGASGARIARDLGEGVVNCVGRTSIEELVALFGRMDMLITPDTGLLHVADALGVPLVAIFGPTDPVKTGPYIQRDRVMVSHACPEAPCFRRECGREPCDAMRAVSPRAVFERAAAVMEEAP